MGASYLHNHAFFKGDLTFDIEPTPKCVLSENFGYPVHQVCQLFA